jgi:hypothetical protein
MVYTVSVNGANTDGNSWGDNIPGEIWIGRADDNGNHASDGHAFGSRPQLMRFWYRYSPIGSETFGAIVRLLDSNGNAIAIGEVTDGPSAENWTQMEIPLVYSDLTAKAASIYVSFKSCSGSASISKDSQIEIAGEQKKSHIGSVLRIDDVELIY